MLTWAAAANIATVMGVLPATIAVCWAIFSFRREIRFGHYTELDRLYFDIVSLRIEGHVSVARGSKTCERDTPAHDFALLIWNFVETIHDRCKTDSELMGTWEPIIDAEAASYGDWFVRNEHYFKQSFRDWVYGKYPQLKAARGDGAPDAAVVPGDTLS